MLSKGVWLCLLLGLCQVSLCSVGCLNPQGKPVDWWVAFKVPYLPGNADVPASTGYAYAYADAVTPTLKYSGLELNATSNNAVMNTLNQIYQGSTSTVGWLMYNDESPSGTTYSSYGHTKGTVGFDNNAGFWLVHSVPRWPFVPPNHYLYPQNETSYGQSFLCMTFTLPNLNEIGGQFLLNKPYVYSSNLNSYQKSSLPNMESVVNKKWITAAASKTVNVKSTGGVSLRTFAKNGAWNQSLYEDLAEPGINSGMLIETWQNGSGGKMPSFCTPQYQYDSMNILSMAFNKNVAWPESKDHSKWGVSSDVANWVCIGDINRMYSQNTRGGGTYCFQNSSLYSSLKGFISSASYC